MVQDPPPLGVGRRAAAAMWGCWKPAAARLWSGPLLGGGRVQLTCCPPKRSGAPKPGAQHSAFANEAGRDSKGSVKVGTSPATA